jgi:hypothetical protein
MGEQRDLDGKVGELIGSLYFLNHLSVAKAK